MRVSFKKEWFFWIAILAVFLSFSMGLKEGLYWTIIFVLALFFFFYSYSFFDLLFYKKPKVEQISKWHIDYNHLIVMSITFVAILILSSHPVAAAVVLLFLFIITFVVNVGGFLSDEISEKLRKKNDH